MNTQPTADDPTRIPIATPLSQRDFSTAFTDGLQTNCFVEKDNYNELWAVKRPGISLAFTFNGGGATVGQGLLYYSNYIYSLGSGFLFRIQGGAINGASTGAGWTSLLAPIFKARYNHASVTFQNQVWVVGGFDGANYFNDVWASPDGTNWSQQVSAAPWGKRAGQKIVVFQDKMYIMGGSNAGVFFNDVWVSSDGVNWAQTTANAAWGARNGFGAVSFNNGMWVLGGVNSVGGRLNDVWFSIDGATWVQQVLNAGWSARGLFGCAAFLNKIYVFGGNDGALKNDTWSSVDGITWVNTAAASFSTARQGMGVTVYGGRLYANCGFDGAFLTQIWSTPDGINWSQNTAAFGGTGRTAVGLATLQVPASVDANRPTTMIMTGGQDGGGVALQQTWRSNLDQSLNTSWALPFTTQDWVDAVTVNQGQYLFLKNVSGAAVLNANAVTQVTNPNYPLVTVPGVVNLDDSVYVMDPDGVIYGSDLETPLNWSALNYLTAEYESDGGVALVKYQNYVVALKNNTIQFFFDAGNSFGSPLQTMLNATSRIGCASAGSVVSMENTLFWVGRTQTKGRQVFGLNGFTPVPVSDQYVQRVLDSSTMVGAKAWSVKANGHTFYKLTLPDLNLTLSYDLNTKVWGRDTYQANKWLANFYATDNITDYVMNDTAGLIYRLGQDELGDAGQNIDIKVRMNNIDLGTNRYKYVASLALIGDTNAGNVTVQWSDDDYQTFSGGVVIDTSLMRPYTTRLGRFRIRAYQLTHSSATQHFRMKYVEMVARIGT